MTNWPLFWCLYPEKRAELMQFYWDKFGMNLIIPPNPFDMSIESLSEIDRLMRKPPEKLVRVK